MREVASDFIASEFADGVGLRWQSHAILALQEAAEAFLVHLFEDAYDHSSMATSGSKQMFV